MAYAGYRAPWLPLRILTVLVLAGIATPGCNDDATQPDPTATLQFSGTVSGFSGLALSDASISVSDGSGTVVASTSVPLGGAPAAHSGPNGAVVGEASFNATIEVDGAGPFTWLVEILDGASAVMYESPAGTAQGGIDQQISVTDFAYVGPGADVVTVEIYVFGGPTFRVGEELTAEAHLIDGVGTLVQNAPVDWSTANGELELIRAYTEEGYIFADFRALTSTTSGTISVATPIGVDGSASVEIVEPVYADLVLDVALPRFPGLEPTAAWVELMGDVAKDTTVELSYPPVVTPTTVALQLVIPVDVTFDDAYTVDILFLEGETGLYSATGISAAGDGIGVPVELDYVGPGSDASTVEITLSEAEVVVGGSTVATAAAKDAGGAVLTGVPFHWTLTDPGLSADPVQLRQGPTEITVEGGSTPGTYEASAATPTGVSASVTITLTEPPGSEPVYIDFSTYPDGSPTAIGPLGNEYADWGVLFGFIPYTSTNPVTGMPHLAKDSPGTTAWIENGKLQVGSTSYGYIEIEFTAPVTKIDASVYPPGQTWVPSERYVVLDQGGNPVTTGVTFNRSGLVDTIEYEGGIGRILIDTGNYTIRVLDLAFN